MTEYTDRLTPDDYVAPLTAARIIFNESMSTACLFGPCEECPDKAGFLGDELDCTCVCHIPDDEAVQ